MMESQAARLAAWMISRAPTNQPPNTPSARMMTLCSAFLFSVPFAGWVISSKRYWVILAERRSTEAEMVATWASNGTRDCAKDATILDIAIPNRFQLPRRASERQQDLENRPRFGPLDR
jgi:hypothetical protein